MDISDEELFNATSSCNTSTTNINLNLMDLKKNSTYSKQEKDSSNITKDISVKLNHLSDAKAQKKQMRAKVSNKKKFRNNWKHGIVKKKVFKQKKNSPVKSKSKFLNKSNTETTLMQSGKEKEEKHMQRYIQSNEVKLYNKKNEHSIQNKVLQEQVEKEEEIEIDSHEDNTYVCARTLPYNFDRKRGRTSDGITTKDTFSSSLSSSSKNRESSSYNDKFSLFDCSSTSNAKKKQKFRQKLKCMVKNKEKQVNKWKFKRKYIVSDSESEDLPSQKQSFLSKKRFRILLSDSDDENTSVNDAKATENSNHTEFHFPRDEAKMIVTRPVRVTLTRLEEMKDENIVKWSKYRTKFSNINPSESERQLDRQKLVQNLVQSESQDELMPLKENGLSSIEDSHKDSPLIVNNDCNKKHSTKKLKLHKLRKKYMLFKKPRVLMIKLDTLKCSSKDGIFSATEVDYLTKKYLTSVINSPGYKSHGLKTYRHLRRRRTMDIENNESFDVSRKQNMNETFTKENSKDIQGIENNSKDDPFKIHRKFAKLENQDKSLIQEKSSSEKQSTTLSPKHLEIWRNAFRASIIPKKLKEKTSASTLTSRKSTKKNDSLPSTSKSSLKHNTLVESSRKFALSKKQTEILTKFNDVSKFKSSSVNNRSVSSDVNVEKIRSVFSPSKNNTNSKSSKKNKVNAASDVFLQSRKTALSKSFKMAINRELSNDMSAKSKVTKVNDSERSSQNAETHLCSVCGLLFKSNEFVKHIYSHEIRAILSPSKNASKSLQEQCSSVNEESILDRSNKSVDSDINSPSCISTSASSTTNEYLRTSRKKSKVKQNSSTKAKNSESKAVKYNRSNVKIKARTCKICLQVFENYEQLFQHMFKHMANDLRSMYTSIENKIAFAPEESSENNHRVSDETGKNSVVAKKTEVAKNDVNEKEERVSENMNDANAENLVLTTSTEKRNEIANSSSAIGESETEETSIVSNTIQDVEENKTAESPSTSQSTESFTICACHRPKINNKTAKTDIQIEIVLLCSICQILFRRFECFEAHYTQQSATFCNKNRQYGRKSKLLCVNCQQIFSSNHELMLHLKMHSRINCKGTVTFHCNICKVIFYNFGQLFRNHFLNHAKNPFFVANRLSFPRPLHFGSKLIKLSTTDKAIEVYMQVADYVCQECKIPFTSAQNLKSHKATCPNIVTTSVDPRSEISNNRRSVSGKIPILLICGFCNKTFNNKMTFETHSLEHTQKSNVHQHYVCVSVTPVTKVFICKVCTTMWQSLQKFEEHWKIHSMLQEEYVCSECQNHYKTIDLFEKHASVHKSSNETQQIPITCEVIYRDINDINDSNSNTDQEKNFNVNNLPCVDLSYFDNGKESIEKTVNDKSRKQTHSLQKSISESALNKQKETTSSERFNEELQVKDISQVPVKVPLPNAAVAQSNQNNNSPRNIDNDTDEEEELTIVLSESEESSITNGGKRNADAASSNKCQNMQENTTLMFDSAATFDEQTKCFNNVTPIAASVETMNTMDGNANSNIPIAVTPPKESINLRSNVDANNLKNKKLAIESTTEIDRADKSAIQSPSSSKSSPKGQIKELLPKNIMSSVPKCFLRVKSLAELRDTPLLEKHFCQVCDMSFESQLKLKEHISIHNNQVSLENKQGDQASLPPLILPKVVPPNVEIMPMTSNSLIIVRSPSSHLLHSAMPTSNVSPSVSVRPNVPSRVVDGNSQQYQTVGVKPMHPVKVYDKTTANVSKPRQPHPALKTVNMTSQQNPRKTGCHQNLPPQISHPLKKSAQPVQQYQSTSTIAIRPFLQTAYQRPRPSPPLYSQQLLQQQQPQLHELQQQQPQLRELQQQQPQLHELQQRQPQLRELQQPQQQLFYQQQEPQLQTQQQRLQMQLQQPQMNINNNVLQYLVNKTNMSYQFAMPNMGANPDNLMLVTVNAMQQISKNPDRYICLYCPGFECASVQEFALHEHSPKHIIEARNRYNNAYVSRT